MKKWMWVSGGAIVAIVIVLGSGVLGGPDDKTQIQDALKRAVKASKEGRPGGVLEYLSHDFELNQTKFSGGQIARYVKENKPNVEVPDAEPRIDGDTATIDTPVKLALSLPPVSMELKKVKLEFKREDTRRFLIFPSRDWRLSKVTVDPETYSDLEGQYGSGTESFGLGL